MIRGVAPPRERSAQAELQRQIRLTRTGFILHQRGKADRSNPSFSLSVSSWLRDKDDAETAEGDAKILRW